MLFWWDAKWMSPASSKNTSRAFITFIQSLPSTWSLPGTFEGSKHHISAKTWQRPKISPKFMFDQALVHYRQTIWEADLKNNPKTHWGKKLTNSWQFGFRADHSMTLQRMRLTDHFTLHFNNNMSTAAVLLDIAKAFNTWHPSQHYNLSEIEFSTSLIKVIASFLTDRKFKVLARRRIFYATKNSCRGPTRFGPCPNIVQ
jgi:hypothetical protein